MILSQPMKNMGIYALSLFLSKGVSLFMLPLITYYLTVDQVGKLELLATISACFGIMAGLALHECLYRFAGVKKTQHQRWIKASELFTFALILGTLIAIGFWLVFQFIRFSTSVSLPFTVQEQSLILLVVGLEGAIAISTAWLRMIDKPMLFFKISITTTGMQVCGIMAVLHLFPTVIGILTVGAVASVVQLLLLQHYNHFDWQWPARPKVYLGYALPLALSGLIAFGLSGSERWIIAFSSSLEQLAHYAIAIKLSLAMCILVQPFGMWWMPKRFTTLEQKGPQQAVKYTQYGMVYIALLTVTIAFAGQVIILFSLPLEYADAAKMLIGTLAVAFFKEQSELLNLGLLHHKKTHWLFAINLTATTAGLTLCGFWATIGISGILIALIIAQGFRCLLVIYFSHQLQPIPYAYKSSIALMLCVGFCLIIAWHAEFLWMLIVGSILAPIMILLMALITRLVILPSAWFHPSFKLSSR
ncbi:hypothetical protein L9W73_00165 [Vibrio aestuarianus]|uniref:Uncharacterized protein n=2 Tax=Vibrio aestuarianus TaxID=28171 RepID=A0A9X4J231_9VIBR|nr:hypothetical protein [Vibrio aestuarianus]MDE1311041.1 hypothetical protein [Vibrio aestuarianus]MDE1355730.1 hypothetical protein [Vibrio aestuarianus]NGZ16171.1 hypothetical protein [Vibrio aestuarianus]NGZ92930.1 hypothetical protein [Vibrio aestuarianus subsp. cardii]